MIYLKYSVSLVIKSLKCEFLILFLQSLQYHMDNEGFCLQHLFTSQAFENGILGLAKYSAICSVKHGKNNSHESLILGIFFS